MDAIHILNTGMSDCLILESDGKFALIDAAEDTDNPRGLPTLNYPGFEKEVTEWILTHCRGEDGKVTFEFLLGTHTHSDHLGGFDTLLEEPDILVKKAYLRPYQKKKVFPMEVLFWDNQEVYDQTVQALNKRKIPIVEDFDQESCRLGQFKITFLYGDNGKTILRYGENANSVVALVTKNNTKALLAADLNYKNGGEMRIAKLTGKVDLLKVGHHGTVGSTSYPFAKILSPKVAVITNKKSGVFPDVKATLKRIGAQCYYIAECGGVTVIMGDNGNLTVKTGIC